MNRTDRHARAGIHLPQLAALVGADAEVQRSLLRDHLRCVQCEAEPIRAALRQGDLPSAEGPVR